MRFSIYLFFFGGGIFSIKFKHYFFHLILDVKPTNVLINSNGEIKLCDFGVSGILVESVAKTYTGCSFYMAVRLNFILLIY